MMNAMKSKPLAALRIRRHTAASILLVLLSTLPVVAVAGDDPSATIAPRPDVQAPITQFADAHNEAERGAALDQLAGLADTDHEMLVRQLVFFSKSASNEKETMASGAVIARLGISDLTIARALVPLLDTTDESLAKSVRNILGGVEGRAAGRRPDFSIYREMIADKLRAHGEPPAGLVRYMYESDPGEALLAMMRANQLRKPEEIRPILWAEHVVSDVLWKQRFGFLAPDAVEPAAIDELSRLSDHQAWWVRLYVAEILRQHPAFRTPQMIARLSGDPDPFVREASAGLNDQHE